MLDKQDYDRTRIIQPSLIRITYWGIIIISSPRFTPAPEDHSITCHIFLPPVHLLPRRSHGAVSLASSLNVVAVDAWRRSAIVEAFRSLFLLVIINKEDIESVNMPRQDAEDREADVDQQVGAAACHDVDTDGRDCKRLGDTLGLEAGVTRM